MGVGMLLQARFRRRSVGDIDCGAYHTGIAQRDLGEVDGAALAAHHRETLGLLGRIGGARRLG